MSSRAICVQCTCNINTANNSKVIVKCFNHVKHDQYDNCNVESNTHLP